MFGQVADLFEGPAFEEGVFRPCACQRSLHWHTWKGEQWRALTKIKVRKEPSINAPQMEEKVIEKGTWLD